MKIFFFISTLRAGGAERVASVLCNAWASSGHEIVLCTLQSEAETPHYHLDPRVELVRLGLMRENRNIFAVLASNTTRIRVLRSMLVDRRPDVLVSFMMEANFIAVLAATGLDTPVVISERTHPGHHPVAAHYALARRFAYARADRLVAQTRTVAAWCERALRLSRAPEVIPNPVDRELFFPPRAGCASRSRRTMVSVGRLGWEKAMHVLIDAFAEVALRFDDWDLAIYGDGAERDALQNQIDRLQLSTRITLHGQTRDVASILRQADLFVLASRYEGFPNAIAEALACGVCVITTDAPGGIRELLTDGEHGLLVPVDDVDAWTRAMARLMADDEERARYARQGEQAMGRLAVPEIAGRWLEVFASVRGELTV